VSSGPVRARAPSRAPSPPQPPRTIIVGDVHGCIDELRQLLGNALGPPLPTDRVVLVGDLIDKGPWPLEVLRLAKHSGYDVVVGNHEDAVLKVIQRLHRMEREPKMVPLLENDLDPARIGPRLSHRLRRLCASNDARGHLRICRDEVRALLHSMTASDLNWITRLPTMLRLAGAGPDGADVTVVHAGLAPNVPLNAQRREVLVSVRNILANGKAALEKGYDPSLGSPWASMWHGPEHVVFGHDARRRLQRWPHATGLDTGCVYGGNLTALVLPAWELHTVACPTYEAVS
jgi:hypothetical protein